MPLSLQQAPFREASRLSVNRLGESTGEISLAALRWARSTPQRLPTVARSSSTSDGPQCAAEDKVTQIFKVPKFEPFSLGYYLLGTGDE